MKSILFIFLAITQHGALAQEPYWQQRADFVIDVKLDDDAHTLDAFMELTYFNNSPDTLHFIWLHIWPNAYKNDQTAFSEQLLQLGKLDFYFAGISDRGYINRLDFRSGQTSLQVEEHPLFMDVIKLILNEPLPPGNSILLTTPFHVKLPKNFSRGGHVGQSYQMTQWYPKPAVYDRDGWHLMPYLHQGEFYAEFGSYDVRITIPGNYKVAATGVLSDEEELNWLKQQRTTTDLPAPSKQSLPGKPVTPVFPASSETWKTLRFRQEDIHDFAWFADKRFIVGYDTVVLPSGKAVDVFAFFPPAYQRSLQHALAVTKKSIVFRSGVLGDYPYPAMSVVLSDMGFQGGMEYPMVTIITGAADEQMEVVIEHETGHNWFQAALATNERLYPWMDEGMNSYYGNRYAKTFKKNASAPARKWLSNRPEWLLVDAMAQQKKDQPINTPSENFSATNYGLIAYIKAAAWMEKLEQYIGRDVFDSAMRTYYSDWKYKHPQPSDFRIIMETISGRRLDTLFNLLSRTGPIQPAQLPRALQPAFIFSARNYERVNHISVLPLVGFNQYDRLLLGAGIHNYNLPLPAFQFYAAPMYGLGSRRLNGLARIGYQWFTDGSIEKISIGLGGQHFSKRAGLDTLQQQVLEVFTRITPSLHIHFRTPLTGALSKRLEIKTFLIREKNFSGFSRNTSDSLDPFIYTTSVKASSYYVNQATYRHASFRALYPYHYQLQLQQGKGFYRLNAEAGYFFNYNASGGLSIRLFAAKFGYLDNDRAISSRFHPRLMGTTGEDDYTYSNYFLGRTATVAREGEPIANKGIATQQIMVRDGGLKMRLDYFDFLQGRSDNWVAAINLSTSLPQQLFPVKLPLQLFFDAGTHAEAWERNSDQVRFLYTGGIKLSLFKQLLQVYAPLVYNREIRDNLRAFPELNTFWKRMTFSIDLQQFSLRKLTDNHVPL